MAVPMSGRLSVLCTFRRGRGLAGRLGASVSGGRTFASACSLWFSLPWFLVFALEGD